MTVEHVSEDYGRRLQLYVAGVGALTLEGRTNDVHHACEEFLEGFNLSDQEDSISNLNELATDTFGKSEKIQNAGTTNRQ